MINKSNTKENIHKYICILVIFSHFKVRKSLPLLGRSETERDVMSGTKLKNQKLFLKRKFIVLINSFNLDVFRNLSSVT